MTTAVRETLHEYVLREFLPDESPDALTDETELISSGVITSVSMLRLVSFIEKTFSVRLDPEDMTEDRLNTLSLMVALVAERTADKAKKKR